MKKEIKEKYKNNEIIQEIETDFKILVNEMTFTEKVDFISNVACDFFGKETPFVFIAGNHVQDGFKINTTTNIIQKDEMIEFLIKCLKEIEIKGKN